MSKVGGGPCGTSPKWRSPPRYADNAANRRRFGGIPPGCPSPRERRLAAHPPKLILQRRRRSTTKRRHSASMSRQSLTFVELVQRHGRRLGEGKQSIVYAYKGTAVKVFDTRNDKAIQMNIDFLRKFGASTGVVPKYIASSLPEAWIQMEIIDDRYRPLRVQVTHVGSVECREKLLIGIAKARAKLPHNMIFSDLTKMDNIAYRITDAGEYKVKFYEGGTMTTVPDQLQAYIYVNEMAQRLRVTRTPFAMKVKNNKVPYLR